MSSARQQRLGWPCSFPSSSSSSSSVWVEVRVVDFGGSAARHGRGDGDCGAGLTAMSKRSIAWRINPATGGWLVHWTSRTPGEQHYATTCYVCASNSFDKQSAQERREIYILGPSSPLSSAIRQSLSLLPGPFFPRRVTGPRRAQGEQRAKRDVPRLREVAGGNLTPPLDARSLETERMDDTASRVVDRTARVSTWRGKIRPGGRTGLWHLSRVCSCFLSFALLLCPFMIHGRRQF